MKISIMILFILMIIPISYALNDTEYNYPEFSIYGIKSNHIFVNSSDDITKTYSFTISNDDREELNFTIIKNESISWLNFMDNYNILNDSVEFSIDSGEKHEVEYIITLPKNTKIGNYSNELYICTEGYHSKVKINIEVKEKIELIDIVSEGIEFGYLKIKESPYIIIGILIIISILYLRKIDFRINN